MEIFKIKKNKPVMINNSIPLNCKVIVIKRSDIVNRIESKNNQFILSKLVESNKSLVKCGIIPKIIAYAVKSSPNNPPNNSIKIPFTPEAI